MTGSLVSGLSGTTIAAVSVGGFVVGGLVSAASTHVDGTRDVRSRRANDYQLQPTSQESARKSIEFQRLMGGLSILGGAAMAGFGVLASRSRPELAIMGATLAGAGVGKLVRLSGAEDKIDRSLPEHTAAGEPEMRRRNIAAWASDGAGYSASGIYSGAWTGPDIVADGVQLAPGVQAVAGSTVLNPALAPPLSPVRSLVLPGAHGGDVPIANAPAPSWGEW